MLKCASVCARHSARWRHSVLQRSYTPATLRPPLVDYGFAAMSARRIQRTTKCRVRCRRRRGRMPLYNKMPARAARRNSRCCCTHAPLPKKATRGKVFLREAVICVCSSRQQVRAHYLLMRERARCAQISAPATSAAASRRVTPQPGAGRACARGSSAEYATHAPAAAFQAGSSEFHRTQPCRASSF